MFNIRQIHKNKSYVELCYMAKFYIDNFVDNIPDYVLHEILIYFLLVLQNMSYQYTHINTVTKVML